jgi:hypothetical protein
MMSGKLCHYMRVVFLAAAFAFVMIFAALGM